MSSIEIIDQTQSTNSELAARANRLPNGHAIMALRQTAGRGQRGNTWESQPGMNITLSLLIRPESLDVRHQFSLSEAVALGVVRTLSLYGITATVKWPNDIYVDNRKICGILIENTLEATRIARSIAGIGLNVNQRRFTSDAPNPISIWQLLGREHDISEMAHTMIQQIMHLCDHSLTSPEARPLLHIDSMDHLWRNDNEPHPYLDPATGTRFMATIHDIAPTGHITLHHTDGITSTHAFKEVQALIDNP